jgi:hypothetical protein
LLTELDECGVLPESTKSFLCAGNRGATFWFPLPAILDVIGDVTERLKSRDRLSKAIAAYRFDNATRRERGSNALLADNEQHLLGG